MGPTDEERRLVDELLARTVFADPARAQVLTSLINAAEFDLVVELLGDLVSESMVTGITASDLEAVRARLR